MQYLQEFREKWRSWVGAALGLSVGAATNAYTSGLFAPHMIAEFGWSRAVFALHGTLTIAMFLLIPVVGRLTDLFGSRNVAAIGVLALPLSYVAFSLQTGEIYLFFILSAAQMIVGSATMTLVYCRIVALNFTAARGFALAVCASAPALLMTFGVPLLGNVIESHGWRAGYLALAVASAVIGLAAVAIIPPNRQSSVRRTTGEAGDKALPSADRAARRDYRMILRTQAFWPIFGGMFLCNSASAVVGSQFGLMMLEQGASSSHIPWLISLYTSSIVIGRFLCGISLDHLPSHLVAAVSMAMPAIGLLLLGAQLDLLGIVAFSVITIGLAQGSEGDLVAYLVSRHFPKEIYGSVAGLISAGMVLSTVIGTLVLSMVLHLTDSFAPFLLLLSFLTLIGAFLFIRLGNRAAQFPLITASRHA